VHRIHGKVRHPESQGQVENYNKSEKWMLSWELANEEENKWVGILQCIAYHNNISLHRDTRTTQFKVFHNSQGCNRQLYYRTSPYRLIVDDKYNPDNEIPQTSITNENDYVVEKSSDIVREMHLCHLNM